ncbi:MAG TPA: ABC transporter permease [Candidatus Eremiobacteraceae bacterium]|nr:ABC transporter permease [Candidatus Eremiobacteraceae bacterium]
MSLPRKIARGLRLLFRRELTDRELSEEIGAFTEMAAQEKMKQGMNREDALRAVRLELGTVEIAKEEVRSATWESFVENLWRDIRFAARSLRKSPGFSVVVILTLTLGIGANTAIFTLVNAVMLQRLPVRNPEQLYRLGDNNNCCVMVGTQNGGSFVLYSYSLYEYLRDHSPEFEYLAAFESYLADLSVRGPHDAASEPYNGELVSGNYFQMLGVNAAAGRLLASADDTKTAAPVAVMSYHIWQKRFGLDPGIIGSTLVINGTSYTVVGITAPQFYGDTLRSDPPDFWLPLVNEQEKWRLESAASEWLYVIGRLKPGFSPDAVQTRLTVELQQWLAVHRDVIPERDQGDIPLQHIRLTRAARGVDQLQTDYALGLRLLATLSALLLLIACANIANLMLARGSANQSQTSVRLALGGTRARLMQQSLVESVLLAVAGGLGGLYVAYVGGHALLHLAFRGADYVPISATPSVPVLLFALTLSLLTGIVFGIAPAWIASRSNPADTLRGSGRGNAEKSSTLQKSLIVAQVALSIVLLVGAALLTSNLRNLEGQRFGFVTDGRIIVHLIGLDSVGYTEEKLPALYQKLESAFPQIPGVISASLSTYSPLEGNNWNDWPVIQGRTIDYTGAAPSWLRVGPHYFETLGTPLLQGRAFEERDKPGAPRVAVVNETFARRFFPNGNAIGQRFGMSEEKHSGDYEIVGIVEDAKYQDTRGPAYATFFFPLLQAPPGEPLRGWVSAIELHVAGRVDGIEPAVRRAIAGIDPRITVLRVLSFGEQVALNFNQERLMARLTELFGALALILACLGLYGLTAYSVARRTNEIGIRMALGADRGNVLGLVLRSALMQVGLGLAIGIPAALAGGYVLASQLYQVKSYDPVILGAAALILAGAAVLAASIPARRASRVDPIVALRHE